MAAAAAARDPPPSSERVHKTRARAQQFREAVNINTSLHYLQMVIVALHEQARRRKRKGGKGAPAHVPFRNSMLTTVLKDSLGGNSLTSMLATLSPDRAQTGVRSQREPTPRPRLPTRNAALAPSPFPSSSSSSPPPPLPLMFAALCARRSRSAPARSRSAWRT